MKLKVLAAAAAATAIVASSPASAQYAEGVAAIVNDRVISTFDVRQRANLLLVSAGLESTPELQERARAQALRDLVDERLQIEEAARFEITITPDQVDRRLTDIARNNDTTLEGLARQLANDGVSISTLRTQIEADVVWQRLIAGMYGSRVRVSEAEISETQERIAANATRPQYLISEIFLPAESETEFAEMQQGAMSLLEQMQRGAPFPLVARQFSQSASAAAGGDLGWIAATELAPELQAVANQLQAGQVSLPVRTPTGVYILAMRERREGAAQGSTSVVTLSMITAPAARADALQRAGNRINDCGEIERRTSGIDGASVIDLGQTRESDLSPAVQSRIASVQTGDASSVVVEGETASMIVVCGRETGGGGVPSREEIENRLREQELTLLAERYLRNLRREATIITRQ